LPVPPGEVWRVVGVSVTADAGAIGTIVSAAVGLFPAGSAVPLVIMPSLTGTFGAAGDRLQAGLMIPPLVLGPGSQLSASCQNVPAAGYTLTVRALFHRLPA